MNKLFVCTILVIIMAIKANHREDVIKGYELSFNYYDMNQDGKIDATEVKGIVPEFQFRDIQEFFISHDLD